MFPPRRTWRRLRPQLSMGNKITRPELIPCILIFFAAILLLCASTRTSRNHPLPDTIVDYTTHPPPNFTPPPLRAVIISTPSTSPSSVQRTIDSISDIPITVHQFGPDGDRNDSRVDYVVHMSIRPYEDPIRALHPPALYLRAGTILSKSAISWLTKAREVYGNKSDIAGFSLAASTPRVKSWYGNDHLPSSWRDVDVQGSFAYGLLEIGDGFLPNVGRDFAVWETFSEWLLLRRSDWYRYPEGEGVDNTPLGMSALPERNWTRGAWNVWFSKFLAEYKLRVVYSGIEGLMTDGGDGKLYTGSKQFHMGQIETYDANGRPVTGGMFKPDTVAQIVDLGRRQGGMVSFTLVNKVFLDTARSWLCNVDIANMRPKGLLWAVTDLEAEEEMRKVGGAVVMLDEVKGGKETGHDFGNPGYWRLMLERTALIGELLRNRIALFAFETDAIWLEDPQPYIDELVSQGADIVGTINSKEEVAGNFFYLRPTLATRRLWDEITERFRSAYKKQDWSKKAADSWTYIENDQSQLTRLVLQNDTWRRSYPLSFLTLDMELFVDGRWYKPEEGFYTSKRARQPVVVNNNFAIGIQEKTERARKNGHWFWDEREKKCLVDVINKAVRKSKKR